MNLAYEERYDEGYRDGRNEGRRVALETAFRALERMLMDSQPKVRVAALEAAAAIDTARAKKLAPTVINDRSKSVREAAQAILAKGG